MRRRSRSLTCWGDFDSNGILDISDIDDLLTQVAGGENPPTYDLNDDTLVNFEDIRVWTKDLANTWIGDVNLDGQFDSGDLVDVFKANQYEDSALENSSWATGDWNGDHEFNSSDLVAAFQDNGFEQGTRQAVAAVPESSTSVLLLIGLAGHCDFEIVSDFVCIHRNWWTIPTCSQSTIRIVCF